MDIEIKCKSCPTTFYPYHPEHIYCCSVCMWDAEGVEHTKRECTGCGSVDTAPSKPKAYKCHICREFSLNPRRTDIQPRIPTQTHDRGTYVWPTRGSEH